MSSTVTDGINTVTLASNTYDGGSLTNIATMPLHDTADGTAFTYRGNVTQSLTPGSTRNMTYDIAGNVVSSNDGNGHTLANTFSSATQYAAPDKLTPGGNDSLSTTLGYTYVVDLSSMVDPGAAVNIQYDYYGRVSQTTSATGELTAYTYDPNNVNLITSTIGYHHIVKTTRDGLGRTVKVEDGDDNGTKSVVETQYDSCACSPLGKVKQVSRPYKPGDPVYWTVYTYDALGRTTRVDLPGGTGSTTYAYQGNLTTVTDPAGKWKTYTNDAMGNLTHVSEPAPGGGTHETAYSYNVLNQMTQVSMPRSTGTQTRTFNYDLATARLTSAVNPENGTVQYTYNPDGTLLRKTDAKGQKIEFSYDTYQRVTRSASTSTPSPRTPADR